MNIAVILAGGTGTRMNISIPKQFLEINCNPILSYTLRAFEDSKFIDKIIIVSLEEYISKIKTIISSYNISKCHAIVKNGDSRQKSVYNALSEIKKIAEDDDIIVIHDGARAMIKSELIDKCVIETKKHNATTLANKTKNTIILSKNLEIEKFIDRNCVYNIQTPQSFRFHIIYNAHLSALKNNIKNATDDTFLVINNKNKVHIIENSMPNLKLTTTEDIMLFEYILNNIHNNKKLLE